MNAPPEPDAYRPISRRRRLLIMALAVATAVTVVAMLLDPPGGVQRPRTAASSATAPATLATPPATPTPAIPTPANCAPGQQSACVGGKADVLAPRPAASR